MDSDHGRNDCTVSAVSKSYSNEELIALRRDFIKLQEKYARLEERFCSQCLLLAKIKKDYTALQIKYVEEHVACKLLLK